MVDADRVFVEYDWPSSELPTISVNTPRWRYEDRTEGVGGPQFYSTVALHIEYRAEDADRDALVTQLDDAADAIESAVVSLIVGPPQFGFRRIASLDSDMKIDSGGAKHAGFLNAVFNFEYPNSAEPQITDLLQQVRIIALKPNITADQKTAIEAGLAAGDSDATLAGLPGVEAGADFPIPQ